VAQENKIDGRVKDTRQRILREAENLYYRGGYAGINLQELAATIGITKAALFHHFSGKQELFFEMQSEICNANLRSIEAALASSQDTRSRLHAILEAMSHRPFFDPMKFITDEIHQLNPAQQQAISEAFTNSTRRPIMQVIAEGVSRGELKPHNQRLSLMAFLNLMMLLPSPGNPITRDILPADYATYIDELLDMFLGGIAATTN
jgi:AcrR family transcriptional regulator